jgi:ribosomal protein S12 methylthiotransferase accessory factor
MEACLADVVSPIGGLISRAERTLTAPGGGPPFAYCAVMGDLTHLLPNVSELSRMSPDVPPLAGVGMAWDEQTAWTCAVAEALERYSACVLREDRMCHASANELGDSAMDLTAVPRCSQLEFSHPACPLTAPDLTAPMRWVQGLSLRTLRPVWLPAVMVHIRIPKRTVGEHFWLPLSSGCAAHPNLAQAIVNAICEIIERDAVALLWLQRLALPKLDMEDHGRFVPRRRGRIVVFDATTDLGIPTLYAVDCAPDASKLATLVCSACDLDPCRAAKKLLAEAILYRLAMEGDTPIPSNPDLFTQPVHGALFMSHPDRQNAFGFLLKSRCRRRLSEMASLDTGVPERNLLFLVKSLANRHMDVFVADLTTDESRKARMHVVRVLIPALQPLTFRLRARYLGHPRLADGPRRMGYEVSPEEDINPWPQPFG